MNQYLQQFMEKYTSYDNEKLQQVMNHMLVNTYKKGTILLKQGEISDKCYLVLAGCIRQYSYGDDGEDITHNFFTEEQAVVLFTSYKLKVPSDYYLSCIEDSTLLVGSLESEERMYEQFPELQNITRSIMEMNFGKSQDDIAQFMGATPEERYRKLLEKRPDLINRVPQYQLASYLGMTPESFSRIKKRITLS